METRLKRPRAVSILAIRDFVSAGLLFGLSFLIGLLARETPTKEASSGLLLVADSFDVLAVGSILCGFGLWRLKGYGRTLQRVLSTAGLIVFPFAAVVFAGDGGLLNFNNDIVFSQGEFIEFPQGAQ
jgi:hypothetical protein